MAHAVLYQLVAINQLDNFISMYRSHLKKLNQDELYQIWNQQNQHALPRGYGTLDVLPKNICEVSVFWFYEKSFKQSIKFVC